MWSLLIMKSSSFKFLPIFTNSSSYSEKSPRLLKSRVDDFAMPELYVPRLKKRKKRFWSLAYRNKWQISFFLLKPFLWSPGFSRRGGSQLASPRSQQFKGQAAEGWVTTPGESWSGRWRTGSKSWSWKYTGTLYHYIRWGMNFSVLWHSSFWNSGLRLITASL